MFAWNERFIFICLVNSLTAGRIESSHARFWPSVPRSSTRPRLEAMRGCSVLFSGSGPMFFGRVCAGMLSVSFSSVMYASARSMRRPHLQGYSHLWRFLSTFRKRFRGFHRRVAPIAGKVRYVGHRGQTVQVRSLSRPRPPVFRRDSCRSFHSRGGALTWSSQLDHLGSRSGLHQQFLAGDLSATGYPTSHEHGAPPTDRWPDRGPKSGGRDIPPLLRHG